VVAFKALKAQIDADYLQLKADGFQHQADHRPCSCPTARPPTTTPPGRAAFTELTAFGPGHVDRQPSLPENLIPVGIGDCDRAVLSRDPLPQGWRTPAIAGAVT